MFLVDDPIRLAKYITKHTVREYDLAMAKAALTDYRDASELTKVIDRWCSKLKLLGLNPTGMWVIKQNNQYEDLC